MQTMQAATTNTIYELLKYEKRKRLFHPLYFDQITGFHQGCNS